MALITCSKCGRKISEKAVVCPHCGYTINHEKEVVEHSGESAQQYSLNSNSVPSSKKKKTIITVIAILLVICVIVILFAINMGKKNVIRTNADASNEKTAETAQDASPNTEIKPTIEYSWGDGQAPTEVGNEESKAKILDTKIVDSYSFGTLLVMDFEYINNSEDARNFINDINCTVTPYQNGIALELPGITSETGTYDFTEAYTSLKKGGTIKTQLAWILKDTVNPIEIDFGRNAEYKPEYSKTLNLSGGEQGKAVQEEEQETVKSDYNISWENDQVPERVGGEESSAIIKNTSIIESQTYGTLLVMDFEYTNNREDAQNFINDIKCSVTPFQNGIALEKPGVTSESGKFDYSDAFTSVKKGGTITAQLVWVLQDNKNPVEIEFGHNENYEPEFISTFTIAAN